MIGASSVGKSWRLMGAGATVAGLAAAVMVMTATADGAEKVPATIDVANYPPVLRESYKVFTTKCTRCHTVNRVISADYVLPDQWRSCVTRMMNKWFSGIKKETGGQIVDFLIYDSVVRKKPQLDEALARLSAEARKAAEDRIAEIKAKYEKEASPVK